MATTALIRRAALHQTEMGAQPERVQLCAAAEGGGHLRLSGPATRPGAGAARLYGPGLRADGAAIGAAGLCGCLPLDGAAWPSSAPGRCGSSRSRRVIWLRRRGRTEEKLRGICGILARNPARSAAAAGRFAIATGLGFPLDSKVCGEPAARAFRGSGEMANTLALGASAQKACGFKSRLPHQPHGCLRWKITHQKPGRIWPIRGPCSAFALGERRQPRTAVTHTCDRTPRAWSGRYGTMVAGKKIV